MDLIYVILLPNRVRFNINLPYFLSYFFELLFPKSRVKDKRNHKPRGFTKPTSRYMKYKRDVLTIWGHECAKCGISGTDTRLTIHHLHSFSKYPDLKLHPDNGVPLCLEHHKEFHELYSYNNFKESDLWSYLES